MFKAVNINPGYRRMSCIVNKTSGTSFPETVIWNTNERDYCQIIFISMNLLRLKEVKTYKVKNREENIQ